jgi:tripartite-type tricarboxylate transporter receptor subunit TctC
MFTTFRKLGLAALFTTAFAPAAFAQWPERPVDLVVAFGAGGGTDTVARILAEQLSADLGQPVVVNNKPGAGGTIGAGYVAAADADGYTSYIMATGHTIGAAVYANLPYDAAADFAGVSKIAEIPYIFVAGNDFEASTIEEMIALAKARPGDLTFASVGVGSSQHFAGELIKEVAGIDMLHIPYQNTPEALAALLSGEVDILVEVVAPMIGQVSGGDIKALGITTATRHPNLPDVGTVAEAGLDFEVAGWYGASFPAGTPAEIIARMNTALHNVLAQDAVRERLLASGFVVSTSTPEEFQAFLTEEVERWNAVRETAGIAQR